MSNFSFNVNFDMEEIFKQMREEEEKLKQNTFKKKTTFDAKNYLQAKLSPNEDSKTLTIRLLPFKSTGGTSFQKVYMHQVKVNKDVSESGWKTFPCPLHNGLGDKCPFCEIAEQAKELKRNSIIESERKRYADIEHMNTAKEQWIVRCIERGKEEDGVKFWLFPHRRDGKGVYDSINNLIKQRNNESLEATKQQYYLLNVDNGKDLVVTLSKSHDGKTITNVMDKGFQTPLTNDIELGMSWINDDKKWEDVYTIKPYDYMAVIAQGGTPSFDKELKKYVNKVDLIEKLQKNKESEIKENLTIASDDLSQYESIADNIVSEGVIDDDLPF